MGNYEKAIQTLEKYDQKHLLTNYENLSETNKKELINQILSVDFDLVTNLFKSRDIIKESGTIEPIQYVDKAKISEEDKLRYIEIGTNQIKSGKLAVLTMAGRTRYQAWP